MADTAPGGEDQLQEATEPAGVDDESTTVAEPAPMAAVPQPLPSADQPILVPAAPAPAPSVAPMPSPAPASAPAAPASLRAEPYALPIEQLNAVAQSAGLEWVHSDSDKVRAAQAAIAAEAMPPRQPRQPKPPVVVDDGPLVLVETRKDLSQVRLPFDNA
jgi:ribonuclease E